MSIAIRHAENVRQKAAMYTAAPGTLGPGRGMHTAEAAAEAAAAAAGGAAAGGAAAGGGDVDGAALIVVRWCAGRGRRRSVARGRKASSCSKPYLRVCATMRCIDV